MSFAMVPGMTLEQMQRVMGGKVKPELPALQLQQDIEPPAPKRARAKGKFRADDPATPEVNEAWEAET